MADRIWTDIERLIGRVYADRGLAYALQGKVLDLDVDNTRGRVSGSVRASDGGAYEQQIVLDDLLGQGVVGIDERVDRLIDRIGELSGVERTLSSIILSTRIAR